MYDIIPGGGEKNDRPARPIRPNVGGKSQRRKVVYAGPRTVQLEWKLPSRLRKPIREQLAKQRAQKQRRKAAAVSFARKPIHTQPLLVAEEDSRQPGGRVRKPRRFFNRGVEHNTGDVYSQGKPDLHVAAPPYIGRVARREAGTHSSSARPASRQPAKQVVRRKRVPAAPRRTVPAPAMPVAERDVPMQWDTSSVSPTHAEEGLFAATNRPKRVMPGVTFSLWPGNWFGGRKERKEKVPSAAKKKLLTS